MGRFAICRVAIQDGEAQVCSPPPREEATYIKRLRRLFRQHVEDLLGVGRAILAPQVFVAAAQLGSNVVQSDVFVPVALQTRAAAANVRGRQCLNQQKTVRGETGEEGTLFLNLSFQLFSKSIEIEILQPLWVFQDLL